MKVMKKWTELFTNKPQPRCERYGELTKWLVIKKKGDNCSRGFWVCTRYA